MKPLFGKVGVFGVGLLGGSVALGIKERFLAEEVHAYDQDPMALEKALFLGVADRVHTEVGPWVGGPDLGILAAPVGALAELGQAASDELVAQGVPSSRTTSTSAFGIALPIESGLRSISAGGR